jgi:hypothetical protein
LLHRRHRALGNLIAGGFCIGETVEAIPSQLATEKMELVNLKVPVSMIVEIDRAASRVDPAAPNRSSWIRGVIYRALVRERRSEGEDANR